jgi:hypothetical protein
VALCVENAHTHAHGKENERKKKKMSDWRDVDLGRLVLPECAGRYVDTWWGQFLVAADLFPLLMTLVIFGFSIQRSEFITFYGGLTLSANLWINVALRQLFDRPPPAPPCGGQRQMPALSTQHSVCIALFALLVVTLWRLRASLRNLAVLMAFVATVTYARIYIGKNSVPQLLAGAGFGVVVALSSFAFYVVVVHRHVDVIIRWPVVRWFGFANTLNTAAAAAAAATATPPNGPRSGAPTSVK